jgi:hypothetical protein
MRTGHARHPIACLRRWCAPSAEAALVSFIPCLQGTTAMKIVLLPVPSELADLMVVIWLTFISVRIRLSRPQECEIADKNQPSRVH